MSKPVPENFINETLQESLKVFQLFLSKDVAVPVAAMNSLLLRMQSSSATTWMQLEQELRATINYLQECDLSLLNGRTNVSLTSGCELFMKYVTRSFLDSLDFNECKKQLLTRGERFAGLSLTSRMKIADIGHSFVQDNCTVLIHGNSRVVSTVISKAAQSKHFNVIITEGAPSSQSHEMASQFTATGIPVRIIYDSAVASVMDQVDLCLVGAEGVMENGGIINKLGTYQIAIVAKALKKPFYVAVESYKFARLYPFTQRDVTDVFQTKASHGGHGEGKEDKACDHASVDFTPAEYISLLFTDLGVLTPAAVSDELIKLYQ